jgi:hypothetical protein
VQPAHPLQCQFGCTCAHLQSTRSVACCGSSPTVYYPYQG